MNKQKDSVLTVPTEHRVLLHACCAPCSSSIIEWMIAHEFIPIVYFCNPNIFPLDEYTTRKNELIRFLADLSIPFVEDDYEHEEWKKHIRGLETEPERGARCQKCFNWRLMRSAQYAAQNQIPLFTTTLSSSRWKNIEQINLAGAMAEKQYPTTHFWAQNWKKGGLQQRRAELLREHGFYNQLYCGCEFSIRDNQ